MTNKTEHKPVYKDNTSVLNNVTSAELKSHGWYNFQVATLLLEGFFTPGILDEVIDLVTNNDKAHDIHHSMEVYNNINYIVEKCDINANSFQVALFALVHDAWSKTDRENHNVRARDYCLKLADSLVNDFILTKDQILEVAESVFKCRSGYKGERTEFEQLVKAGDFGPIQYHDMMNRAAAYRGGDNPTPQNFKEAHKHLQEKYGRNGYAIAGLPPLWHQAFNSDGELERLWVKLDGEIETTK